VRGVQPALPCADVLVVDYGSNDRTRFEARAAGFARLQSGLRRGAPDRLQARRPRRLRVRDPARRRRPAPARRAAASPRSARERRRRRGDRLTLRRGLGLSDRPRPHARPQAAGAIAAAARRAARGRSDLRLTGAGASRLPLLLRRILPDRFPGHRRAILPTSPGTAVRRGARRHGAEHAAPRNHEEVPS
jgi:hypothetical protein